MAVWHGGFGTEVKMVNRQQRKNGLRRGENHPRAKLSNNDIETIFFLSAAGLSHRQIADKFDDEFTISKSTVRDILSGRIRGRG